MSEKEIEREIQDKGLTAPRLTPALIDGKITGAAYHVFNGSCLTVCCLTLVNGFTVTGESACASPENFDAEIGAKIAYEQARDKIWMLEGYLLKEKLYQVSKGTYADRLREELSELTIKMQKLSQALESGRVPKTEVAVLEQQFIHMVEYRNVLKERTLKL